LCLTEKSGFIVSGNNSITTVTLFDLSGTTIPLPTTSHNNAIDISMLAPGYYLCKIDIAGNTVFKTVLIK